METKTEVMEQQLQKEVPTLVKQAEDFKVSTDLQAEEAAGILTTMKTKLDAANEFFAPMKEATHKAWKAVCERQNGVTQPLEGAIKILRQKVADYTWKKQEEQRKKEDAAAAAAKEKEDKKRKDLLDRAKTAADKGDHAEAERLTHEAGAVYVAPRPVTQAARPTGVTVKAVWEAEITDEKKVPVKWRGEIDVNRLKRAKSADEKLEVPGIRFFQRAQGAVRGAR